MQLFRSYQIIEELEQYNKINHHKMLGVLEETGRIVEKQKLLEEEKDREVALIAKQIEKDAIYKVKEREEEANRWKKAYDKLAEYMSMHLQDVDQLMQSYRKLEGREQILQEKLNIAGEKIKAQQNDLKNVHRKPLKEKKNQENR